MKSFLVCCCLSLICSFSFNDLDNDAQTKFCLYCEYRQIDLSLFQGVSLDDLDILEDFFQINVMVHEFVGHEKETACRLIENSRKIYSETMN